MLWRAIFIGFLTIPLWSHPAIGAMELSPEEIETLVAAAAKRSDRRSVAEPDIQVAAAALSALLAALANEEYETPSANQLLMLARTKGVSAALLLPSLSLLDSASLVGMPEASGDILTTIALVDRSAASGLKSHMAATGMGGYSEGVDVTFKKSLFAAIGARLGFNKTAPKGELSLEKAAGVRSPISGFNSAEFIVRTARGEPQPLTRKSGDVATEKRAVMEKLPAGDWSEVKEKAFAKSEGGSRFCFAIGHLIGQGENGDLNSIIDSRKAAPEPSDLLHPVH